MRAPAPTASISLVGLIGVAFDNVESVRRQVNRYAPLTLDADDGGTADAIEIVRENGDVWMKFTTEIYKDNPLLTESGFAHGVFVDPHIGQPQAGQHAFGIALECTAANV